MNTPVSAGKQMSASLKARLKKCGRSYNSPVSSKLPDGSTSIQADKSLSTTPVAVLKPSASKNSSSFKSPALKRHAQECGYQTPVNVGKPISATNSQSVDDATRRTLADEFNETHSVHNSTDNIDNPIATTNILTPNRGIKRKISEELDTKISTDIAADDQKEFNLRELQQKRIFLLKVVAEKEENLRKLKMVKLYRSKNNLDELHALIAKWKSVCQEALPRLHSLAQEPRPTLTELIDHLQIEHDMIGYSAEEESFS